MSRAYELVAIADGRTTVEAVKAGNNERYHKSQAEKKFRESTEKPQPTDSVGKNVKQPNNLGGRPVAAEGMQRSREACP